MKNLIISCEMIALKISKTRKPHDPKRNKRCASSLHSYIAFQIHAWLGQPPNPNKSSQRAFWLKHSNGQRLLIEKEHATHILLNTLYETLGFIPDTPSKNLNQDFQTYILDLSLSRGHAHSRFQNKIITPDRYPYWIHFMA